MTNLVMLYSGAVTLGALHAFEPGHGKTLIAAYMIGTRGRAWDGILLGAIVTITHTFSVILLGILAQILSRTYSEETLHNWLGLVSAGIILAVGIWMLRQRLSGKSGHTHIHLFGQGHSHDHHHPHTHAHTHHHDTHNHEHDEHQHDHKHDHHHHDSNSLEHSHEHHHPHTHHHEHDGYHEHVHHNHESHEQSNKEQSHHDQATSKKTPWELFMLGISGGIIPCPAAIATLLAAIAAGKIAQGLSVTLFFSLGLGIVMMSIGVILSQAGRLTNKIGENLDFARRMGVVSALLIIGIGSYTMLHSVRNIWF
ncbi:HoxN/HupN/NixA family nickel/cobalt transporter [Candidatus Electrothrix sp.]|uniref:HoxN/HupN/NixA family nickel/cobalt transporter n=2 Tax=Candidatus Electrothrix sp. TaxID=2170559 RepID=UPI0040577422